jgi:hypothetical protein
MTKRIITLLSLALACVTLAAQSRNIAKDFSPVQDSLKVLLRERTTITSTPQINKILRRGNKLDFYFTRELGDYPWHSDDVKWLRSTLTSLFPEGYEKEQLGDIFLNAKRLETLETPTPGNDGKSHTYRHSFSDKGRDAFITRPGERVFSRSLIHL